MMKRMQKVVQMVFLAGLVLLLGAGCAAMDGVGKVGSITGYPDKTYDVYSARSADSMGINTATTAIIEQDNKTQKTNLVYANTAAQTGIKKEMVGQIIPAVSNTAGFALNGFLGSLNLPETRINTTVTGGGAIQGQGQFQGQGQGQGQGVSVK